MSLHHFQLSQEVRLVHEVPLVPVMNMNIIIWGSHPSALLKKVEMFI